MFWVLWETTIGNITHSSAGCHWIYLQSKMYQIIIFDWFHKWERLSKSCVLIHYIQDGKIDLFCTDGFASLVQGKKRSLCHIICLFFYKGCLVKIAGKWCEVKVNSATGFGPEAIAMQSGAFCSYPRGETFFLVPSLDPNDSTVTWKYTSGCVVFTWFPFLDERGQLSSLQVNSVLQNPVQAIWVTRDYVCLFSTY